MKSLEQRQNELRSLLNEFKTMEQNRKDHDDESKEYIKKQHARNEKIRKENELLKTEITNIARSSGKTLTVTQQEILRAIHESGDKYAQAIAQERELISDLEYEIQQSNHKLLDKRKEMGGANASRENDALILKQTRILEHRLEKSIAKFNESIAQNKELRSTIDELRKEQVVYEHIYLKMERELQEKKEKMAELIESSNAAYEQRDAALLEISVIEQADHKEKVDYDKQMNDMNNLLENELKLPTFTSSGVVTSAAITIAKGGAINGDNTMGRNTSVPLLKNTWSATASTGKFRNRKTRNGLLMIEDGTSSIPPIPPISNKNNNTNTHVELLSSKSTNDIKNTINNNNVSLSASQPIAATPYQPINHVQNFEEAFERIKQATGIDDVSELVRTFIKNEQNNYSLFKYVNEQNAEISKIQDKIDILQKDEDEWKLANKEADTNKQMAQQLEKTRFTNMMSMEKYDLKNLELQNIFNVSLQYIKNMSIMLNLHDQLQQYKEKAMVDEVLNQELQLKDKHAIFATNIGNPEEQQERDEINNENNLKIVSHINDALQVYNAMKTTSSSAALFGNEDNNNEINTITELNFTEYVGKVEDKLIHYMGQYNAIRDQIQHTIGSMSGDSRRIMNDDGSNSNYNSSNKINTTTTNMIFPDDDIPDHLRNPPSPSVYASRVSTAAARTLSSAAGDSDAVTTQSDMTSMSILEKINSSSNSVHPSELNIETGEDHATMLYYGTAVNDDRPMSKAEITNSAIHTIRQKSNTNSRRNSVAGEKSPSHKASGGLKKI